MMSRASRQQQLRSDIEIDLGRWTSDGVPAYVMLTEAIAKDLIFSAHGIPDPRLRMRKKDPSRTA